MATVSKLLIRLQKFSSKISKVIDATDSFSSNNNYYQDLSGWDSAVVQVVGLTGSIGFGTTNDDGSITGQLLPAPEVPINWVPVLGVDLSTKTDVFSITADGIVEFGIIGKYLLLQGSAQTTTTAAPTTTTTTSGLFSAVVDILAAPYCVSSPIDSFVVSGNGTTFCNSTEFSGIGLSVLPAGALALRFGTDLVTVITNGTSIAVVDVACYQC